MKGAPIVMIAHGTGIAPFISIMERLNNLIRNSPDTD
jgi:sulfite reductase alpha subunit-like flavoprotein